MLRKDKLDLVYGVFLLCIVGYVIIDNLVFGWIGHKLSGIYCVIRNTLRVVFLVLFVAMAVGIFIVW